MNEEAVYKLQEFDEDTMTWGTVTSFDDYNESSTRLKESVESEPDVLFRIISERVIVQIKGNPD